MIGEDELEWGVQLGELWPQGVKYIADEHFGAHNDGYNCGIVSIRHIQNLCGYHPQDHELFSRLWSKDDKIKKDASLQIREQLSNEIQASLINTKK